MWAPGNLGGTGALAGSCLERTLLAAFGFFAVLIAGTGRLTFEGGRGPDYRAPFAKLLRP